MLFHVLNRGVGRMRRFLTDADFEALEQILEKTLESRPMRIAACCLMSKHWRLVFWPERDDDLAAFMQKLTITHARNWQVDRRRAGYGRLYQGRYKSFASEDDEHFYQVVRDVERHALGANLGGRAEDWRFSGLWRRVNGDAASRRLLSDWPLPCPRSCVKYVNRPQSEAEFEAIRRSVERGQPYGGEAWVRSTTVRLGLQSTRRARGRPKKTHRPKRKLDVSLGLQKNMQRRELFPGQFIKFGKNRNARHWLGGTHSCEGAWCTNCALPLMLHLSIDCSDPLLSLSCLPCSELSLFYCMRCSLCWHDFTYRILSDDEIEIVEEFRGETTWDDWYYSDGGAGDVIERRPVQLAPIPSRLQELYDRLNADEDLSEAEEEEVASFTGNYARPAVGGYPIVDVINQLGGRSFLNQRLDDPGCPGCKRAGFERQTMYFLASLTNDDEAGVRITYDALQIVFFQCPTCGTIKVQHSA